MLNFSSLDYLRRYPSRGEILEVADTKPIVNLPSLPWAENIKNIDNLYVAKIYNPIIVGTSGLLFTTEGALLKESGIYYRLLLRDWKKAGVCGTDVPTGKTAMDSAIEQIRRDMAIQEIQKSDHFMTLRNRRAGSYLSLLGLWTSSFCHWICEYLPKAIAAARCDFDGYYIIPPGNNFARESLLLLGIDPEQIIVYDETVWRVETLYVPGPISLYVLGCFPSLVDEIRSRLSEKVVEKAEPAQRLYVARRNTDRSVVNETELADLLTRFDFEKIHMEDLSFEEQLSKTANASCIIGPHGAGMTHCLFMNPGSLVIELFPPTYINPCMVSVMQYLHHRYFMIPGYFNPQHPSDEYKYDRDILAPLDIIKHTVDRELC